MNGSAQRDGASPAAASTPRSAAAARRAAAAGPSAARASEYTSTSIGATHPWSRSAREHVGDIARAFARQRAVVPGLGADVVVRHHRDVAHLDREHRRARHAEVERAAVGTAYVVPDVDHHAAVRARGVPADLVGGAEIGHPRPREVLDVDQQAARGRAVAHRSERLGRDVVRDVGADAAAARLHHGDRARAERGGGVDERGHRRRPGVAGEPVHAPVELGDLDPALREVRAQVAIAPPRRPRDRVLVVVEGHALETGRGGGRHRVRERRGADRAAAQHEVVRTQPAHVCPLSALRAGPLRPAPDDGSLAARRDTRLTRARSCSRGYPARHARS